MQAEVFIRTGERSAMNYLFKPLQDRIRAAMTED
jgi:protease secretion system membrane fusion protein